VIEDKSNKGLLLETKLNWIRLSNIWLLWSKWATKSKVGNKTRKFARQFFIIC
jgi:hypothetical protein